MPGIVGFTKNKNGFLTNHQQTLREMQLLITYEDFYIADPLFCDDNICATRSHINIIETQIQPHSNSGIYIWLHGEFYNKGEVINKSENLDESSANILLCLFRKNKDFSFLKAIDGIFSAVIYDSIEKKIHLITDRYGLKHLYWTINDGCLAWGSELKSMLALPNFKAIINLQAVEDFFGIGYLLEDKSWFKNVELLSNATVLTWEIETQSYEKYSYWSWDEIQPLSENIEQEQIVEELGRLFIEAVKKHCTQVNRLGLGLSGGLDSRAILAAIPDDYFPIQAITFGKKGCDDIVLAAKAAQVKGATHHIFYLNADNWITSRLKSVWATDGNLNLMHMHGTEFTQDIKALYDIHLHSLAGDLILGGSYLLPQFFLDSKETTYISYILKLLRISPKANPEFKERIISIVKKYSESDHFFLNNRVRRFTINGSNNLETCIVDRKPTYNNQLIEFCYSLPPSLRYQSTIYKKMLLCYFSEYYNQIPWQKTGVPISYSNFSQKLIALSKGSYRKISRMFGSESKYGYTNYSKWICSESSRSLFESILLNPLALYPNYIHKEAVEKDLEMHLHNNKNHSEQLCRYLTFEIWLQQIFENKYRK